MNRDIARKVLQEKFSKDGIQYERKIYNMCVRLAKETNGCIEDVYPELVFEKCGELLSAVAKKQVSGIITDIDSNVSEVWKSSCFEKERFEYEREMDKSIMKPKPVKGVYFCKEKECSSDEFYTWSKQTRSADEPATFFRECAKCGKRGRQ